jgi:hypothetical protein
MVDLICRGRCTVVAMVLVVLHGCGGDQPGLQVDQGVIEVSVSGTLPQYVADPASEVRIGMLEGEAPYQFSRIAFAARLGDGRVVVADGASREIRYFDSQGEFIQHVGGRGQGPGEFEALTQLWLLEEDILLVYDQSLRRVTRISADGVTQDTRSAAELLTVGSEGALGGPASDRQVVGVLDDGRFVVGYSLDPDSRLASVVHTDTLSFPYQILLSDSEGGNVDTVAVMPGGLRRASVTEVPTPAGVMRAADAQLLPVQLMGTVVVAGQGHHVVASRTNRYEISIFDTNEETERVIRRTDVPARALTSDLLSGFNTAYYEVITSPPDGAQDVLLGSEIPTHSGILLDDVGRIWIRGPEPLLPWFSSRFEIPNEYVVMDLNGDIVGTAELPEGLHIFHIGSGYVTGRYRDDLGVETIATYQLSP